MQINRLLTDLAPIFRFPSHVKSPADHRRLATNLFSLGNHSEVMYNGHRTAHDPSCSCQANLPSSRPSIESNSSVWSRLHQTPTNASYRRSCFYHDPAAPNNDLDFRLRTCYDHACESFASKARILVQPVTVCQRRRSWHSNASLDYPLHIISDDRKQHFNESTKGQHIASDHFASGKNGYSRVMAGAFPVD